MIDSHSIVLSTTRFPEAACLDRHSGSYLREQLANVNMTVLNALGHSEQKLMLNVNRERIAYVSPFPPYRSGPRCPLCWGYFSGCNSRSFSSAALRAACLACR